MTDNVALFHNPESFSDQELAQMRRKLMRQRFTPTFCLLLGTVSTFAIDMRMFNSRYK